MAEQRPVRMQYLEVTREQARLWIERLDEWASAARQLGYRSWSTEFTRQSAWLRAVHGRA